MGGSVHTIKKNAEVMLVVGKDFGLEVIADETKHMISSRESGCLTKSLYED
jgi:hypothetical protein